MTICEMLNLICDGVNPLTGELFDVQLLTDEPELSSAVTRLALLTQPHLVVDKNNVTREECYDDCKTRFQELKQWRLEQAVSQGIPAYIVFTDEELWNIARFNVCQKTDLLCIKGIAQRKYEQYGDELFEMLSSSK